MPSAIWKSSGLCALAVILLALATPVRAGDSGGDGGGDNDRFRSRPSEGQIREQKKQLAERFRKQRAEERAARNRARQGR